MRALDHSVLPVQGPPGQDLHGARIILDLIQAGKQVGICATSHTVVGNLLDANEIGVTPRFEMLFRGGAVWLAPATASLWSQITYVVTPERAI